ncbi:MAG TPA: Hpt domain-containing protein [Vicinamibacterales bacterium]|nr:Hpt domain-containing protein [Vicinamibacterales bacterium]
MAGEIITIAVTAMLLMLIVAMVRQRDGMPQRTHQAGSATDVWRATTSDNHAEARPAPPPRDPDLAGRDVMQHFRRLEGRAPGLAGQVLPVFIKDTEVRLVALREALAAHDSVAAHRVAHTLHGSVASVGAATMVHACAEIIRAVRLGAFEGCDQLLRDLEGDFASIRRAAETHRV